MYVYVCLNYDFLARQTNFPDSGARGIMVYCPTPGGNGYLVIK